jgi:phage terminase large subunit
VFDLEKRPDVRFMKSTFIDNPFISIQEKNKILSYDPKNEINVINGTADDYMWNVYGLGVRKSPEGLIFPNVKIIEALPLEYESEYFGIDFGFTNDPTAIVQIRKQHNNLYAKLLCYTPIDNALLLSQVLEKIGNNTYWADSSDGEQGMIGSMRRFGFNVYAAKKYAGSIKTGIDIMKRYNLHVCKDVNAEKEVNNYKWRTINNIALNEPIDKYNHFWDAFRYAAMSNLM